MPEEKKTLERKKLKKKPVAVQVQRKLIKIGDTYYGYIPEEFVIYHGMKEGDPILIIANSKCTISPITKEIIERTHREMEKREEQK